MSGTPQLLRLATSVPSASQCPSRCHLCRSSYSIPDHRTEAPDLFTLKKQWEETRRNTSASEIGAGRTPPCDSIWSQEKSGRCWDGILWKNYNSMETWIEIKWTIGFILVIKWIVWRRAEWILWIRNKKKKTEREGKEREEKRRGREGKKGERRKGRRGKGGKRRERVGKEGEEREGRKGCEQREEHCPDYRMRLTHEIQHSPQNLTKLKWEPGSRCKFWRLWDGYKKLYSHHRAQTELKDWSFAKLVHERPLRDWVLYGQNPKFNPWDWRNYNYSRYQSASRSWANPEYNKMETSCQHL